MKTLRSAPLLLLLGLAPLARADVTIPAQPITLSAATGTDQDNFFITEGGASSYVVFTGSAAISHGRDVRAMYTSRVKYLGYDFPVVGRYSPLRLIGLYVVPTGTVFDNFVANDITSDQTYARELFHIPNGGLFMTTNGGTPVLLRPESAAYPLSNAVFRFPGHQVNESDRSEQLRIVYGGYTRGKGFEPIYSAGSALYTAVLGDLTPGVQPSAPAAAPYSFTTAFDSEVYFVATNPASVAAGSSQTRDIYRSAPKDNGPYSVALPVTSGLPATPAVLVGMTTGLFYTATLQGASYASLNYLSSPTGTFTELTDGFSSPILDAAQLTPQITPSSSLVQHSIAFSCADLSNNGVSRLAIFDTGGSTAYYTDLPNQSSVATTYPSHIVPTGTYFYYTAFVGGTSYLMRCFDGDSTGVQYVDVDTDGNHVTNLQEMVDVTDGQSSGNVYFTGDAVVDGVMQTGVLFSITADAQGDNSGVAKATPVRTVANHPVYGAHHLGAVHDSQVFRLYFSAPVNAISGSEVNVEYAPVDRHGVVIQKDYASKPWVVNAP